MPWPWVARYQPSTGNRDRHDKPQPKERLLCHDPRRAAATTAMTRPVARFLVNGHVGGNNCLVICGSNGAHERPAHGCHQPVAGQGGGGSRRKVVGRPGMAVASLQLITEAIVTKT